MNDLLGITLQELLASLKSRRIRVPSEIGAFVALEVCEAVARGPARVSASDVRIAEDGTVSLFVPPGSASGDEAAESVVGLLASALVAAGTGVPASLIKLVEDGAPSGPGCLERLALELESALVPLNRAAARRVLSRMVREGRRDAPRPMSERPGPVARLDEALDDLLDRAEPEAASPRGTPSARTNALDAELDAALTLPKPAKLPSLLDAELDSVDALLADGAPEAPTTIADEVDPVMPTLADDIERADVTPPRGQPVARVEASPARPQPTPRAEPARARAPEPRPSRDDLLPDEPPPSGGGALGYVLAFVIVAVISAAVLAWMRPDLVDRALGRPPPPPPPAGPTPEEIAARERADRGRYGSIIVRSTPPAAQVLLYVGRGPVVVEDLSPGAAYELIAIADGMAPSRAIIPPDASWETTPEGLRYELAIQTPDTPMEVSRLDLGETRLPDELGTPRAEVGTARVVTSPPGAKVYMLVGFTPDVNVQNVGTEEVVELLVYLEGYDVERVVVAPSDWHETEDGTRASDVDVILHERSRR